MRTPGAILFLWFVSQLPGGCRIMPTELSEEELSSLAALVASKGVDPKKIKTSLLELEPYYRDMGEPPGLFSRMLSATKPQMIIQPLIPRQLSQAVKILYRKKIPFTPRAMGSTGLGGSVPVSGGAVLDLSKMSGIVSVDEHRSEVRVLAGTTFFQLQSAISSFGLELVSRPSNAFGTIGGWAATGGMGLGSLTEGPVCRQIRHMEVVYPDGSLEQIDSSHKTFHDFFQTEGQLGIFASVTLQVAKRTKNPYFLALSVDSLGHAIETIRWLLKLEHGPTEITFLGQADAHPELSAKPGHEIILVMWNNAPNTLEIPAGVETLTDKAAGFLWSKRFFPMDNHLGPIFLASEAMVPLDKVESLTKAARKKAARFNTPLLMHGHAVKSKGQVLMLILFMFPCDPKRGWNHLMLTPLAAILTSLAKRKGASPYGVGIWNTPFAKNVFGARRMKELREKKKAMDPHNLCNPGKFFKVGTKAKMLPLVMARGVYPTMLRVASGLGPLLKGKTGSREERIAVFDRCVWCGACVTTCPAVSVTGSETVSARSKLSLLKAIHQGEVYSKKRLSDALQCLACGQCQEVCARGLDLLDEWKVLEDIAIQELGEDVFKNSICEFSNLVDSKRQKAMDAALP